MIELENFQIDPAAAALQFADAMMTLADSSRQPSRQVVMSFADEYVHDMAGRRLTRGELRMLEICLTDVMKGSTSNLNSSSRFRDVLESMHVNSLAAGALTTRFLAIGEEVRGPDDRQLSKMK